MDVNTAVERLSPLEQERLLRDMLVGLGVMVPLEASTKVLLQLAMEKTRELREGRMREQTQTQGNPLIPGGGGKMKPMYLSMDDSNLSPQDADRIAEAFAKQMHTQLGAPCDDDDDYFTRMVKKFGAS